MKQEERNFQSRRKIIDSALREFGERGYGLSSINTICSTGKISKGILYHYFKDKDELYLTCVEECFEHLTAYLQEHTLLCSMDIEASMKSYFDTRLSFFEQYPLYQKLFCSAVISPPAHLSDAILKKKAAFDSYNTKVLTYLLNNAELRSDILMPETVEVFRLFQDFANAQMQMVGSSAEIRDMEIIRQNLLHIFLYGILARGGATA